MMLFSEINTNATVPDRLKDSRLSILKRIHEGCNERLNSPSKKRKKTNGTILKDQKHVVLHDYHDHANENEKEFLKNLEQKKLLNKDLPCNGPSFDKMKSEKTRKHKVKGKKGPRGGVMDPFPLKLQRMLEKVEERKFSSVVSWQPHGRSFVVRQPKEFVEIVMPMFFRQTKLTSFQRQLNLYGFSRITQGIDIGAYYHELFLRGKPFLCHGMVRTKIKGTGHKPANSPETEPNFYAMPMLSGQVNYQSDELDEGLSQGSQESYKAQRTDYQDKSNFTSTCHPKAMTQADNTRTIVSPDIHPVPAPDFQISGNSDSFLQDAPLDPQAYFSNFPQSSTYSEITYTYPEPDPIEDLISFEGKPFHYLDSNDPLLSYVFSGTT